MASNKIPEHIPESAEARFWLRVDVPEGPDDDSCWEWTGALHSQRLTHRYGVMRVSHEYGSELAHRLAYYFATGTHPGQLFVLHRCDHPTCVRPSHLFLGTAADNARDRELKGRGIRGERVPGSKLDAGRAALARWMVKHYHEDRPRGTKGHRTYRALAALFGISPYALTLLRAGSNWAWIAQPEEMADAL
jgi:hypothetical protein